MRDPGLIRTALFAGLSILAALTALPAYAASVDDWRRNVDAITRDILAIHPAPFAKVGEIVWRREAASLLEDLPELTEPQRIVRLMRLVAMIGDGHTQIDLTDEKYADWYPVRILEFSDGYFVTSAHVSVQDLAGAEILSIAGTPISEVARSVRSLVGTDNRFDAKERLYPIHNAYLMKALGFARKDGGLDVEFRLKTGRKVRRVLGPHAADPEIYPSGNPIFDWRFGAEFNRLFFGAREDWISAYNDLPSSEFRERDDNRPLFLRHRRPGMKAAVQAQDAYYIQINHTTDSTMGDLVTEALAEVDQLKPQRLILDLRYNVGGDGSTVPGMIHEFIKREDDPPWAELYVLTSGKTFSAAVMAVDAFLEHTTATLVGEPVGAPLNFYGDATAHPYPDLGLTLQLSTEYHQLGRTKDLLPFIPVDVPAPMAFSDYLAGRDTALDPILAGEEMRSIPAIALAEGGAAARRVYSARKIRFAEVDWYRPPEEIELRRVTDALTASGRFEDAVETAKLTTEIHPYIWNSWYNLGLAQEAAGAPYAPGRFGSFKCVLLLSPTNWNAPSILELFKTEKVDPEPPEGCPVKEG